MRNLLLTVVVAIAMAASAIDAHHSFSAVYDGMQPITLTGTVTKVSWVNPHSYVYLDVKDAAGKVENWAAEGFPVAALRRQGVGKDIMKFGDLITVNGWRSRDGTNRVAGNEITLADGRKIPFGPKP